jgi:hypothetical protein
MVKLKNFDILDENEYETKVLFSFLMLAFCNLQILYLLLESKT